MQIVVVSYTVAMEVQMLQPLLLLTTHFTYAIDTECKKPEVQRRVQRKKLSTTTKQDIMLNAIGNVLSWEELHRRKMRVLNENQYIQDQKVFWQVVLHKQE